MIRLFGAVSHWSLGLAQTLGTDHLGDSVADPHKRWAADRPAPRLYGLHREMYVTPFSPFTTVNAVFSTLSAFFYGDGAHCALCGHIDTFYLWREPLFGQKNWMFIPVASLLLRKFTWKRCQFLDLVPRTLTRGALNVPGGLEVAHLLWEKMLGLLRMVTWK